ncbi:hypothetical protein L228DRAFT_249816 [Xylona heveae TC161]|uniref:NAP family protein n=1 Tax=Xylona heveae (strain CBS 132557 / TC161) TaxID=1328760 RepID=A0A165A9T0_XYLHT|nr:hypothetical protein L228DRAFT_249816 [Xylona heveae TC161]KZF20142.1 hypothetical protein L228DRAFT_249816 [Xylona heveae TC161]
MAAPEESDVTYEELAELEKDFEEVENEILRKQYTLTSGLYAKRQTIASRIPNFWSLVLEQAPLEIDQFIQPSDSEIIAACLKDIEVNRFEISTDETSTGGDPRSVAIKFKFAPNEWFDNDVLEKKFWYRRANDGWSGLVSEPVKINWKSGKDVTEGLTDAAIELFEAEKKTAATANGTSGKGKDNKKSSAQKALIDKIEATTEGSMSFFNWFGFAGRHITAEESAAATKSEKERREKIKKGEKVEAAEKPEENDEDDLDVDAEVFPAGEELAVAISEDLWPNALKYFTQAQEQDDDDLSEADFEEDEEEEESDEETGVPDLRKLVSANKGGSGDERPQKKRRT